MSDTTQEALQSLSAWMAYLSEKETEFRAQLKKTHGKEKQPQPADKASPGRVPDGDVDVMDWLDGDDSRDVEKKVPQPKPSTERPTPSADTRDTEPEEDGLGVPDWLKD